MTVIDEQGPNEAHAKLRSWSWSWRDAFKPIPGIFGWYKDNVGAGTLIVAAFLVIKGYVIARGNLATALGVLQYEGLTGVVIAGLLSSLPILTALLLGWIVFRMVRSRFPAFPREPRRALVCVLLGSFVLSAFFTPVPFMLAAIGLGGLAGLVEGPPLRALLVRTSRILVWALAGLAAITMLYAVWVPHEIVILRPGVPGIGLTANERAGYVLGYVLADDPGGWITILTSGDRTIVRFRDSTVRSITVCERRPHGGVSDIFYASPLLNQLLHPGTYVKCP